MTKTENKLYILNAKFSVVNVRNCLVTNWTWIPYNGSEFMLTKTHTHFNHFLFLLLLLLLLHLFSFCFYSPRVLSNFSDLLPPLWWFCWPWNRPLMETQWPRAGRSCCIQMWPHAIIRALAAPLNCQGQVQGESW